jgi:hypothetical protein
MTGSAACAQQPHVTHVGGQARSSRLVGLALVHGSAMTRLDSPDALNASNATINTRAKRRTTSQCSTMTQTHLIGMAERAAGDAAFGDHSALEGTREPGRWLINKAKPPAAPTS